MLTDEQKQKIELLPTDEMGYEIQLGKSSRFQREKFAYLKTCYASRREEERGGDKNPWHSTFLGQIIIGVIVIVLGLGLSWVIENT